jgi:hypothetical protein
MRCSPPDSSRSASAAYAPPETAPVIAVALARAATNS